MQRFLRRPAKAERAFMRAAFNPDLPIPEIPTPRPTGKASNYRRGLTAERWAKNMLHDEGSGVMVAAIEHEHEVIQQKCRVRLVLCRTCGSKPYAVQIERREGWRTEAFFRNRQEATERYRRTKRDAFAVRRQ